MLPILLSPLSKTASKRIRTLLIRRPLAVLVPLPPLPHDQLPAFQPAVIPTVNDAFKLRPYQEDCVRSCLDAFSGGANRIGVSCPTGSGKTTIFCTLISRLQPPQDRPDASRALVLVGSIELARQAAKRLADLCPELKVEIEQGQQHRATGLADVTVATYQSLSNPKRLAKHDPSTYKVVIVDEAHHAVAPSYLRVLSYFNHHVKSKNPTYGRTIDHKVPIVGLSATFSRHDKSELGQVFEKIVYHRDFIEMMEEKWLSKVVFTLVCTNIDLSLATRDKQSGEFKSSSLARVLNTDTINELVVKTWLDRAADRKSTLIFCADIKHVQDLTACFRAKGVDARYVTGSMVLKERNATLDEFRLGTFPVLVNCAILTEGADVPNIDCILVARPTGSKTVFAQMIGRGMRLSPLTGKKDCRVIDFVDSMERVGGIMNGPTLFGVEPDEVINDSDIRPIETMRSKSQGRHSATQQEQLQVPTPSRVDYIDDDPFSVTTSAAKAERIDQLSSYAWVKCGKGLWVLGGVGKGAIRLEKKVVTDGDADLDRLRLKPGDPCYVAKFISQVAKRGDGETQGWQQRDLLVVRSIDQALNLCDQYAQQIAADGNKGFRLERSARWRKQAASDKQIYLIRELDRRVYSRFKPETMTRGEAANVITMLKHGDLAYLELDAKVS